MPAQEAFLGSTLAEEVFLGSTLAETVPLSEAAYLEEFLEESLAPTLGQPCPFLSSPLQFAGLALSARGHWHWYQSHGLFCRRCTFERSAVSTKHIQN